MKQFIVCFSLYALLPMFGFAGAPDTLWTHTYGDDGPDRGYDVQQTSDGGYIISGYTSSWTYDWYAYLIKTDANGDTLWTRTFGGFDYYIIAYDVLQSLDKGYVIAGVYNAGLPMSSAFLGKTDSLGSWQWFQFYGGLWGENRAYSVQQLPDSGFIVAAVFDTSSIASDVWLLRTDADGETLWTKTFGGTENDEAYSVQLTTDGGYIIAGKTYSFGIGIPDSSNMYLIKTDSLGDTLWTKTYGGPGNEEARSIQQTSDGGYIVVGSHMVKTDANGDTLWTKPYSGNSVDLTSDGGYIITGGGMDVSIIKTDALGNALWTKNIGGAGEEEGRSVQQTSDGGYIIVGYTTSFGAGSYDVYLIKLASDTIGIEEEQTARLKNHSFGPTIMSGPLRLPADKRCRVFDITGRIVNSNNLRPGIYFIEIDKEIVNKVVKIR